MTEVSLSAEAPAPQADAAATRYRDRLRVLQSSEKQLQRKHLQLGYLRLLFGIGVVALLLPPRLYALLPLLAFAIAARAHEAILRQLAETRRAIAYYEHAIARAEDRWAGLRPRAPRVDLSRSLFTEDLDLFGPASLFELLCEARTTLGEDTLASWMLQPAPVPLVLARQSAVADLRSRLPLREAFAKAPGPATATLHPDALSSWGETSYSTLPGSLHWVAPLLSALVCFAVWCSVHLHSLFPVLLAILVNSSLTFLLRHSYLPLFAHVDKLHRSLHTAGVLIRSLEDETFTAPHMHQLQSKFLQPSRRASAALVRLATLSTWIEARNNYLVRILDLLLPYSLQLAVIVGRWQLRYGPQLRPWLQTLAEGEALLSLAAYSFEHPDDPFPEFTGQTPTFHAKGLTHPLLGRTGVRNDVALDGTTRVLLVSGSNMSGKSTLLRSVGVNAVLAFAGAPVRADSLHMSPWTLAASIRVNDSLQAGRSRFFTEILRLRAITEAARTQHVLFLLDEVLAGTNSSDRLTGARALVEELLRHNAIGLLSTHDLALTDIATSHQAVRNAHFEDQITDDRLLFDYTLRDGVLKQSNGLALMRLVGLNV